MVAQVALAVVLLTGAVLFLHSLKNAQAVAPGFDLDHLLHASVDLRKAGYKSSAAADFYDQAVDRLRTVPGVEGASLISSPQLSWSMLMLAFSIPGSDPAPAAGGTQAGAPPGEELHQAATYFAGPDYFRTIGTPIRQGRDLSVHDRAGSTPVVIVNERFAELAWPHADPIGRCMDVRTSRDGVTCYTVVGVAANAKYAALDEPERAAFFIPAAQEPGGRRSASSLVIRTSGDPAASIATVRHALAELDPALPYVSLKAMPDFLRPQLQPYRLGATMFSAFALLAIVLAAVGLYGVIAYGVAQRKHEMGIRLALGARRGDVVMLVVRQGVVLTLVGLGIGIAAALAAARLVRHLLFGVSATDPATFAGVVLALAGAATLACWIPARRATRVDPMVALRAE
jgi:predicted permease